MSKSAVLSDIHGNYKALKSVLSDIRQDDSINKIFLLGDIIDYGAHSVQCIDLLWQYSNFYNIQSVWGNHEKYILKDMKSEISETNERGKHSADITKKELSNNITIVSKLVDMLRDTIRDDSSRISFTHKIDEIKDMVYLPKDKLNFTKTISKDYKIQFVGHTHKSGYGHYGYEYIVNPGSVGQPRNKNIYAQYITYTIDSEDNIVIEFHSVPYDINYEAQSIVESGRDFYYASRLYLGV